MRVLTPLLALIVALGASTAPALAVPRVAVVLKDREPFWSEIETGMKAAAKPTEVELVIKAPYHINSVAEHLKLLGALKDQSLDALIIGPHQANAPYRTVLSEFAERGVKIVCVEDLPAGVKGTLVGYDQPSMAEAAVKQLGALLHPGDVIGLLRANAAGGLVAPREAALLKALKRDHADCKLYADIMTGFEQGDDEAQTKLLLERHPDVTVVVTPYTGPTLAMIRLLREQHLAGKIRHLGFGSGLPAEVKTAVEDGTTAIYVAQLPKMLGRKSVETALALVRGEPVPASVAVDYFVVTPANVRDPALAAANN